ncbi:sentrin-specific protease 1-like [Aphidius gifuensis]|uniref:sentrin-specific protease 1-like n=1 Tax=Aphidius gifuensis TaxID=684658 RepID=UPI001CDBCE75|nr:sentrin-specific protease 1-like [Aphidius gifuensis]
MEGMKTNNVSNNKENNVDLPSKIEKTNSQLESQNFISDLLKKPPTTKIGTFSNDELFVSDLLTLRPTMWLNDKIINVYMRLIMESDMSSIYATNSFFYKKLLSAQNNEIHKWTKNVDIFSKKWMIIPIHLDNHWAVCIVNFIKKTVSYYDSQGRKDEGLLNIILQYLEAECNKRKSGNFSGWRVQHVDDVPKQNNFWDCGAYVCMYALYTCKNLKWDFSDEKMPEIREQILMESLNKKIREPPALIRNRMSLQTSHQHVLLIESAAESQASAIFPQDRRDSQCMAIALYAVVIMCSNDQKNITRRGMDEIIKEGDAYYVSCRNSFKKIPNCPKKFLMSSSDNSVESPPTNILP